jgi:uncharacterized protein (DUF4415 family)
MSRKLAMVKWDQLIIPTVEEAAAMNRGIVDDPNIIKITDSIAAEMRRASDVALDIADEADQRRHARGPQNAPKKVQVTLRLDPDVLDQLRATGAGWQGRVSALLRVALASGG